MPVYYNNLLYRTCSELIFQMIENEMDQSGCFIIAENGVGFSGTGMPIHRHHHIFIQFHELDSRHYECLEYGVRIYAVTENTI